MARRIGCYLALAIFLAVSWSTSAAEPVPFTAKAFASAQAAGRPILVYVDASWCSTCSVQRPVLADVLAELDKTPELHGLAVFTVDFDNQKDIVQRFSVQVQSTLIAFRGRIETGRSVGESDPAEIEALLLRSPRDAPPPVGRLLSAGSYVLAILAGILATLSPCVLPLLPIVAASAAAAHRFGPFALAGGLALSFVLIGTSLATFGMALGLDADKLRYAAAILMLLFGLLLLSDRLQERFALAGSGLSRAADRVAGQISNRGPSGQFVIGLLLGPVWSPCAGPTLGAAITLAATGQALGQVLLVMLLYGGGAALPLSFIGILSRETLGRWRRRMDLAGHTGKFALGLIFVGIALVILTGLDRTAEARLVQASPDWLTRLTTRF